MYKLKPPKVYVMERVLKNGRATARMERMLKAMHGPPPTVVKDDEADDLARSLGTVHGYYGETKEKEDPPMVFNTFRFPPKDADDAERERARNASWFRGGGWYGLRDKRRCAEQGKVCQAAYEIHSGLGCVHKCHYCGLTRYVNIMVNLEEFVEELDRLIRRAPWQTLYKYDNQTDTICFEPEYGASELLVDYFSRQEKACLMLYSKSANHDHLLNLDHKGHTICCWTLSCDTVSRLIEEKTGTMRERIEAARKCQQAGYTVRFRFSPILPIKGWREENRQMIEEMFSAVRPDVLVIETLHSMDAAAFRRTFDTCQFDEEFVAAIQEDAGQPRPDLPFPFEARAKIHRFFIDEITRISPTTRIALCLETPEMWARFGPELGISPDRYLCCCGPQCTPGTALYKELLRRT